MKAFGSQRGGGEVQELPVRNEEATVQPVAPDEEVEKDQGEAKDQGWTEMAAFRKEMAEGQRADRLLKEIIDYLESKRSGAGIGAVVARPHALDATRLRAEAKDYLLAPDGLLMKRMANKAGDTLPVVPCALYKGALKILGAPRDMGWKGLLLAAAHGLTHVNADGMMAVMEYTIAWQPPAHLRRACAAWVQRSRTCMVQGTPKPLALLRSTGAMKPGLQDADGSDGCSAARSEWGVVGADSGGCMYQVPVVSPGGDEVGGGCGAGAV